VGVFEFLRVRYARNLVTYSGALLTSVSSILFLFVFFVELLGFHTNPYTGIVAFLILPGFFLFGLVVIPIGMWYERRRQLSGRGLEKGVWPRLDLNDPATRTATFFVAVMTFVNILIVSLAGYRGLEYMDSTAFCGQVCHTVMDPEFTAYQDGPHSRVKCVECHIGPGAPWFVRSKLSGVRQVFAVMADTYARPVPSPVHNLRPARDTCEQCHWPDKFHGDASNIIREYAEDATNTESSTSLRLHVGSGGERSGVATGIHWHVSAANLVEYIATDDRRQTIPWVRLTSPDGTERIYEVEGASAADVARGERRTMDCVDCHNRPTHPFALSVSKAVDAAMAYDQISPALPWVKRETVAALKESYPSREAASEAIARRLDEFYRTNHPDVHAQQKAAIDRATRTAQALYLRNVFPTMNVTWGTYVNNIGHSDSPGCFRCHDDNHKTKDGQVIRQDCDLCHTFDQ
jgi:hypothetical protein